MFMKEKVTHYRLLRGMTKLELSKISGLSDSHISQIEKGTRVPTIPTINKLCAALSVSPNDLEQPNLLGITIMNLREHAGLTKKDLELRAGLSSGHITRIEKGSRRRPSEETLKRIAFTLRVPVDDLKFPKQLEEAS